MQDKDEKLGLLLLTTHLLRSLLHILGELLDGILQRRPCIVDLVNNQDVLSDEIGLLDGGEIEPLRACNLGAWCLLGILVVELLVERQTDGLDGNVRRSGLLEERSDGGVLANRAGGRVRGRGCCEAGERRWESSYRRIRAGT